MPLTVGSLFAGIGGFDLGFERAGFNVRWQVEIDPYCLKVLEKNFPHAQRFEDIRNCGRHNLVPINVICGGFPCQDISNAGLRAGIDGTRSGLWGEMHRIIGELRPRFVVVENVAALLGRGIGRVLGDLSEIGYDAEWRIISAADMGAPHLRERIWIVAYPSGTGCSGGDQRCDHFGGGSPNNMQPAQRNQGDAWSSGLGTNMAHAHPQGSRGICADSRAANHDDWWLIEPDVGRVAHGIPSRVDRLKGLGNAIVPQIAEMIAKRLSQEVFEFGEVGS